MVDKLLSLLPSFLGKPLGLAIAGLGFLVLLFLKLCFSTALFATLAEITRRLQVFRAARRPAARALLLIPVVVLFCSGVLFVLNFWRLFAGGFALNAGYLLASFLRVFGLALALAAGGVAGFLLAPRIPLGLDRFGAVLANIRGRYLVFWMGTFSLSGVFQMLPWGWASYAVIWVLLVGAALVASVHWQLHARVRALRAAPSPGLPPGRPIDLALAPREAVALSLLLATPAPASVATLVERLREPDAALLAHPAWYAECHSLLQDPRQLEASLQALGSRGLSVPSPRGWSPGGSALRLQGFPRVDEALGLTVKEGGTARTRVFQRYGPSCLLLEPGPDGLRLRELPPGTGPEVLLQGAS